MPEVQYVVMVDGEHYGTFQTMEAAVIFVEGILNKYYAQQLTVSIKREEKSL